MENSAFTPEQNAVLEAILRMTRAFHAQDIEGVMASYEEGAAVLFEPGLPVSDTQGVRQGFEGFFALHPHFEYGGHEVYVNGEIAVHFAPWRMHGTAPDGSSIHQSGLSVAVLRRQADGRWLMLFDNPHGQRLLEQS